MIIRGSTPHFDVIAAEATKGIAQASLETMVPIAFGVVTSENLEWAATKGFDAAITPIEEVALYR